jgi:hypothetical protein
MLGDLRARAVSTRWESFNRQLSAFRLAQDISGGAIAKWLSPSVSPLYRQHVLTLSLAQDERKTPSQWNDGSMEAGLRRRLPLLANCHMLLSMLWLITQLHEC